jgi:alpha-D-ribose 1-methylphosphonate 5-triphosphate diphosphatase
MAHQISRLIGENSLKADHFLHWRCEVSCPDIFSQLEPLAENERTGLYSIMDHTPGQRQFVSLDAYCTYFQEKYGFSADEMQKMMETRLSDHKKYSDVNRRKVIELAKEQNLPVASHDDATLEHVKQSVSDGIVVAEFPTTMEAAEASHRSGLSVLMGTPNVVRGQSHSGNVSARALASGTFLDILSSDYVPFSLLYGATVLERECENIDLPQAINMITRNPARQVGLDDRGEIAIGRRADLVRYNMSGEVPNIIEVWKHGARVA